MAWVRVLAVAAMVAVALPVHADPTFPALTGRVVDDANLLDAPARTRIEGKLAALEAKTTTQLVVVTLPSLQGYDIADYGYRLGRHWGIGQKGANNGALLIVAPNERSVRIEVGYGLEGMLTDAVSSLIIQNAVLPRFRAGDFAGGIERGTDDVISVLEGDESFRQRAAAAQSDAGEDVDWLTLAIFAIVIVIWASNFFGGGRMGPGRRRRGGIFIPPMGGGGFGGRGGGFGGGGFGGGGGGFGGGGSSGRW